MSALKVLSIVFTAIGIMINFYCVWWLGLIGIGVGVWMIIGLCTNEKSIAAGILGILFTGILGGIFYLCWTPE